MTAKIFTTGYTGKTLQSLHQTAEELGAMIVDIRFSPHSRNPSFNLANMRKVLGDAYIHMPELGNADYKSNNIRLVNYPAGREKLRALQVPAILLCACKDPKTCHRTHIAQLLKNDGFEVEEIQPPPSPQMVLAV